MRPVPHLAGAVDPTVVLVALFGFLGVLATAVSGVLIAWITAHNKAEQAALEARLAEFEEHEK